MSEVAIKQDKSSKNAENKKQSSEIDLKKTTLPAYDDELINRFIKGIAQNIQTEVYRQNVSHYELSAKSGISYVHISKLFSGTSNIGLEGLIKIAFGLGRNPGEFMPMDINYRKTNGERFDELTKELDIDACNFLLQMTAEYAKQFRRMKIDSSMDDNKKRL